MTTVHLSPVAGALHSRSTLVDDASAGGVAAASGALAGPRRDARTASVSCVVPALNEARSLRILLPMLIVLLREVFARWEIIVVDDGSTDDTPAFMSEFCRREARVRYLQLSRNFGKESALTAGLELAQGDVVITLDADLQHPPALIPRLIAQWEQGADMVYAVREARDDERLVKRIGAQLFYFMMKGTGKVRIEPDACDFRLMDRKVVDALCQLPERTRFMKGLYAWVGFRTEAVHYQPHERRFGKSSFSLLRLVTHGLEGLTSFTTWPLRVAMFGGVLLASLAILYGLYVIFEYMMIGNPVRGYSTLIVAQVFLAGIILIALGMIGEYVAHIYEEVKQRPLFIVNQTYGNGLAQAASPADHGHPADISPRAVHAARHAGMGK